jgi:hypothetical protein
MESLTNTKPPTIFQTFGVYPELAKLQNEAPNHEGPFSTLDISTIKTVQKALSKFEKHFKLTDDNITYDR